MMKHVSESLAGRVAIVNLYGLSLREIQKISFSQPFLPTNGYFTKREETLKEISYRQIWRLIQQGCMPSMYSHDTTWKLFYSSYTRTYIERDVHQLTTISNESSFLTFLMILASRTAQLLNLTSIANEVGISVNTAKRWLSILISSHIVYLLKPYSSNASKRLVKTPKLYFIDTGLAAYLTKWNNPEVLEAGALSGHFFETYVISEILKSYTNAGETDPPLYFYRDKDQKEIDLIIEENGILHPIEIKKSASPNPGMINSFSVLQKFTTKQVGSGGVVCFYDSLLPIDEKNYIVPVQYL